MKITLLHNTPLWINAHGARTCWDSGDKSDTEKMECDPTVYGSCGSCGPKDRDLIDRVGNKYKHQSILEHVSYNFHIQGVSRALLQELARHRMASLSVKSTRYTLKELKDENSFCTYHIDSDNVLNMGADLEQFERAKKYIVLTGVDSVDIKSISALEMLRQELVNGTSNDKAKYCLPESYKTELTWTINMRSLQNFISLRSDKSALWEIRAMANAVYEALPEEHKYLYEGSLKVYDEVA
jgi:thymidylate synthase (FAD)